MQDTGSVADATETPTARAQDVGNPFFLEQVLRYDADKETIVAKAIGLYPLNLLTRNEMPDCASCWSEGLP